MEQNPDSDVLAVRKETKYYKNTSMKSMRAALCRHYKEKRSIDIISNEAFIRANAVFTGILQLNKENGLGEIKSKTDISDFDLDTLLNYFRTSMSGLPNPKKLQDINIFYILYYMCRRGRENLRFMTKATFKVAIDPSDNRKYIYQDIDEADKNHTYTDTTKSNDGRIYEDPGKHHLNLYELHPNSFVIKKHYFKHDIQKE